MNRKLRELELKDLAKSKSSDKIIAGKSTDLLDPGSKSKSGKKKKGKQSNSQSNKLEKGSSISGGGTTPPNIIFRQPNSNSNSNVAGDSQRSNPKYFKPFDMERWSTTFSEVEAIQKRFEEVAEFCEQILSSEHPTGLGVSALHVAVCRGEEDTVDDILCQDAGGKELNKPEPRFGLTALHFAFICCCRNTLRELLEANPDQAIPDNEGFLPFAYSFMPPPLDFKREFMFNLDCSKWCGSQEMSDKNPHLFRCLRHYDITSKTQLKRILENPEALSNHLQINTPSDYLFRNVNLAIEILPLPAGRLTRLSVFVQNLSDQVVAFKIGRLFTIERINLDLAKDISSLVEVAVVQGDFGIIHSELPARYFNLVSGAERRERFLTCHVICDSHGL